MSHRGMRRGGRGNDLFPTYVYGAFVGIGDGVERRVGMELNLRHVGDDAEFGGLGSADDGDLVSAHGA